MLDDAIVINHDGTIMMNSWADGLKVIGQLQHFINVHCRADPAATGQIMQLLREITESNFHECEPVIQTTLCKQPKGPTTHRLAMAAYLQDLDDEPPLNKVVVPYTSTVSRIWEQQLIDAPAAGFWLDRNGKHHVNDNTLSALQERMTDHLKEHPTNTVWTGSYAGDEEELVHAALERADIKRHIKSREAAVLNQETQRRESQANKRARGFARGRGFGRGRSGMPPYQGSAAAGPSTGARHPYREPTPDRPPMSQQEIQGLAEALHQLRNQPEDTSYQAPPRQGQGAGRHFRLYHLKQTITENAIMYCISANKIVRTRVQQIGGHPLTAKQTWHCEGDVAPVLKSCASDELVHDLPVNIHDAALASPEFSRLLAGLLRPACTGSCLETAPNASQNVTDGLSEGLLRPGCTGSCLETAPNASQNVAECLSQSTYQPTVYIGTSVDPQDVTQQPALALIAKAEVNRLRNQPNEEIIQHAVNMYERSIQASEAQHQEASELSSGPPDADTSYTHDSDALHSDGAATPSSSITAASSIHPSGLGVSPSVPTQTSSVFSLMRSPDQQNMSCRDAMDSHVNTAKHTLASASLELSDPRPSLEYCLALMKYPPSHPKHPSKKLSPVDNQFKPPRPTQPHTVPALVSIESPTTVPATALEPTDTFDQQASGSRKRAFTSHVATTPENPGRGADPKLQSDSNKMAKSVTPSRRKWIRDSRDDPPFDFGLTRRVLNCTGAVAMAIARLRAMLWQRHLGVIGKSKIFPIHLDHYSPGGYDWDLHVQLRTWLTPPCQPSLLHTSLCVPLTGLTNHGYRNQYSEPSYPVSRWEKWLPIPAATYACATAQQAFAHSYIENMVTQLPNLSIHGSSTQRITPPVKDFNEYSEQTLAAAAKSASIRALDFVYNTLKAEPVMGLTRHQNQGYRNEDTLIDRSSSTDCYNGSEMLLNIPDCQCHYCRLVGSKQRFPAPVADDGSLPDSDDDGYI